LNPIENIWAGLKHHLRIYVKPTNKDELINGIQAYWRELTKETCQRYIGYVQKVIPAVIQRASVI
jgi:transposase